MTMPAISGRQAAAITDTFTAAAVLCYHEVAASLTARGSGASTLVTGILAAGVLRALLGTPHGYKDGVASRSAVHAIAEVIVDIHNDLCAKTDNEIGSEAMAHLAVEVWRQSVAGMHTAGHLNDAALAAMPAKSDTPQ